MTSARSFTFTTAVRVIIRVHNNAANRGTNAHVSLSAGLTNGNVFVIKIAKHSDGRFAAEVNHTHLTRGHTNLRITVFLSHQLGTAARTSYQLTALSFGKLYVVNKRTNRNG